MGRKGSKAFAFKRPFRAVPLRRAKTKPPAPIRFWEPKPPTWRESFRQMRPALLVIALLTATAISWLYERANRAPPEVREVGSQFTRCGYGRGFHCVIDGDTFKIGEQDYRVKGIDTAELAGDCTAEIAQAEASTRALQDWLNRGPFEISVDPADPTDRYGRTLASVVRRPASGGEDRLADYMIREGGAHAYDGGARGGWC